MISAGVHENYGQLNTGYEAVSKCMLETKIEGEEEREIGTSRGYVIQIKVNRWR